MTSRRICIVGPHPWTGCTAVVIDSIRRPGDRVASHVRAVIEEGQGAPLNWRVLVRCEHVQELPLIRDGIFRQPKQTRFAWGRK